ncbi:AAA family ATPase [Listeria ivanovii subsp. londoniensis]|uniref:ATP-dependent nuclease n=1 Tax=Listeria ivanovii TaxID=1638 RepID=UPI0019067947|nr:AAA family ATPase [Listeria ivanovii]MBK2003221.1 AAA family ATPase [Listeria ivanovii subsp. londoniensis]
MDNQKFITDIKKAKTKKALRITDNKQVNIKRVCGIHIHNFRTLKDTKIPLGKNLTIISGKNGTMKSAIMGLIGHPFNTDAKNIFGKDLKTPVHKIFKLSEEYDQTRYNYDLLIELDNEEILTTPVEFYLRKDARNIPVPRVVVSGKQKGDGNFNLNTAFINLQRLFPMINTEAEELETIEYSAEQATKIGKFYTKIIQKGNYFNANAVSDEGFKYSLGPAKSKKTIYDFSAISSGEDNLGHLINVIMAFEEAIKQNGLKGILCIDEIEASLHPSAQKQLLDYLLKWSKKNDIQVIFNTHSLYLIQKAIEYERDIKENNLQLNFISTQGVRDLNYNIIENPSYSQAYKELTFEKPEDLSENYKIDVLVEDDAAKSFINALLPNNIKNRINITTKISGGAGTSKNILKSLCKNASFLLSNCIVVLDGDVLPNEISKIKFDRLLILPDEFSFAPEVSLIYYIGNLPEGDDFFVKMDREKQAFIRDFSNYELYPEGVAITEMKLKVAGCKSWAKNLKRRDFNKYVNYYCKNDDFISKSNFKHDFISKLNDLLVEQSLPAFE